ncbi:SDR family NAD(P)-dependent oxidoreductase [Paenarthrobacter aromaticivorans]|uniref:SDR family oxidoreductase n=1 Tax=Paenarthrobacter aromaticivorans TaxID=2849150 RepID=A0ABS6I322_9MICC|nr:SDR family NAD(P)-dependent oxidoreductase [Paenarthrobacter sp. MMS21-TAE1-1]MBU8864802.1 SDR family oxidoreductase [Paenarthrobacter sp. MMS21-TAE1-1]
MNRFKEKVAIVTGGGAGIGQATALRLASEGAEVAVFDISPDRADETAGIIRQAGGLAVAYRVDVSDEESVSAAVQEVVNLQGVPFSLVNAAGILEIMPALEMSANHFDRVIGVNLRGVFMMSTAVARHVVASGLAARIVNVSSIHAAISLRDAASYAASKGGIEALTFTLAADWAQYGITVNAVRPGATWSALTTPMYTTEVLAALGKRIPLGDVAQSSQIASAIAYLASEEASYSTGAVLSVDGGYTINGNMPGEEYAVR